MSTFDPINQTAIPTRENTEILHFEIKIRELLELRELNISGSVVGI